MLAIMEFNTIFWSRENMVGERAVLSGSVDFEELVTQHKGGHEPGVV